MAPRQALRSWAPVVLYAGLIFWLSSLPAEYVAPLFPQADKLYHFLEYLPFGILTVRAFSRTARLNMPRVFLTAFFVVLLYSFSDEMHQLYVPGRQFDLVDIISDVTGAVTGIIIYSKWQRSNLF